MFSYFNKYTKTSNTLAVTLKKNHVFNGKVCSTFRVSEKGKNGILTV